MMKLAELECIQNARNYHSNKFLFTNLMTAVDRMTNFYLCRALMSSQGLLAEFLERERERTAAITKSTVLKKKILGSSVLTPSPVALELQNARRAFNKSKSLSRNEFDL